MFIKKMITCMLCLSAVFGSLAAEEIGFRDFYHPPKNTSVMINLNGYTTRFVTQIEFAGFGTFNLPKAMWHVLLSDGSLWEVKVLEASRMQVGDMVIVRLAHPFDKYAFPTCPPPVFPYNTFVLEDVSVGRFSPTRLVKTAAANKMYQYEIASIVYVNDDDEAIVTLLDAVSGTESTWTVADGSQLEGWEMGHYVSIGSQTADQYGALPKHILINGTLQSEVPPYVVADLH